MNYEQKQLIEALVKSINDNLPKGIEEVVTTSSARHEGINVLFDDGEEIDLIDPYANC